MRPRAVSRSPCAQHERVAAAYGNPALNLSREVTDRIAAGEFTWADDFKDLHPSPFGHQLYANSIERMLEAAWAKPMPAALTPHAMPAPVDPRSYARGRFGSIADARIVKGFALVDSWRPTDGGHAAGFVDVPALVGTEPGAAFAFTFEGTAAGLFITAGNARRCRAARVQQMAARSASSTVQQCEPGPAPPAGTGDPGPADPEEVYEVGRDCRGDDRIAEGHDARSIGTALRVFATLLLN